VSFGASVSSGEQLAGVNCWLIFLSVVLKILFLLSIPLVVVSFLCFAETSPLQE